MKQHSKDNNGKALSLTPAYRTGRLSHGEREQASRKSKGPGKRRQAPQKRRPHNYAFIDSQNVNKGITAQGWKLDWKQFRSLLQTQYNVDKALLFIGFVAGNEPLYEELENAGFALVFKPTTSHQEDGKTVIKGNVDTDLVLHALLERDHYDRAVIASGDGDFHSLAKHLQGTGKLAQVMVPDGNRYSHLLNEFQSKIAPMNRLRSRLEKKRK
jgi:hypothetical protein